MKKKKYAKKSGKRNDHYDKKNEEDEFAKFKKEKKIGEYKTGGKHEKGSSEKARILNEVFSGDVFFSRFHVILWFL